MFFIAYTPAKVVQRQVQRFQPLFPGVEVTHTLVIFEQQLVERVKGEFDAVVNVWHFGDEVGGVLLDNELPNEWVEGEVLLGPREAEHHADGDWQVVIQVELDWAFFECLLDSSLEGNSQSISSVEEVWLSLLFCVRKGTTLEGPWGSINFDFDFGLDCICLSTDTAFVRQE